MARLTTSLLYRTMLQRLVAARRGAGLTQADVARQLGRTQSWVAKSEGGGRRVDLVELASFARLYRRPIQWFLVRHARACSTRLPGRQIS